MDRTYSGSMFGFNGGEIDNDSHTVVGRIRVEKKFEKTRFSKNIREKPVNVVIIVYYYYLQVAAIS